MDTKLKKQGKKNGEIGIFIQAVIGISLLAGFYVADMMYRRSRTYIRMDDDTLFIIVGYGISILVLVVAALTVFRLFQYGTKDVMYRKTVLDGIKTEYIAIGLIAATVIWWSVLQSITRDDFLEPALGGVMSFFCSVPVSILFFGGIVLLIRKKLLGITEESSLIHELRNNAGWQEGFPFEDKMKKKLLLYFVLECCLFGIIFICVIFASATYYIDSEAIAMIIACSCLAGVGVILLHYQSNSIYKEMGIVLEQIEAMEQGDFDSSYELPEESPLYGWLAKLMSVRKNLTNITEKQMRDEKMKIDLITNVSHDLKTPLTAMIGYIDLLKKEELTAAGRDYVEVLSGKHEQLKDMIQDLFELSKVTSGTEVLNLEELDMRKLLEQTLGDMEDQLKENGIEVRKNFTEEAVLFFGDGKKAYRIFQNLLENVMKYSLKGTRVFIDMANLAGNISVTVKNTSAYEMDFTEEEIIERFTRGDESRNMEGNGLGLAIANSFTKAMGGKFHVRVDGDQFKVTVCFHGSSDTEQ